MATKDSPSFAGVRLAELRRRSGLTAEQLADLVPGHVASKTVITNVESGRKRDLTVTEAVALATALGVPLLALVIDVESPWGAVPFEAVAPEYGELTNIEYARRATVYPRARNYEPNWEIEASILDHLARVEVLMKRMDHLNQVTSMHPDALLMEYTPYGEPVELTYVHPESVWEVILQPIIDQYRECLLALDWLGQLSAKRRQTLPPELMRRIEDARNRVVEIIAANSDLDYGQADDPRAFGPPALNPRTGRAVPAGRGNRGPTADSAE